jgi:hypothetical protein
LDVSLRALDLCTNNYSGQEEEKLTVRLVSFCRWKESQIQCWLKDMPKMSKAEAFSKMSFMCTGFNSYIKFWLKRFHLAFCQNHWLRDIS